MIVTRLFVAGWLFALSACFSFTETDKAAFARSDPIERLCYAVAEQAASDYHMIPRHNTALDITKDRWPVAHQQQTTNIAFIDLPDASLYDVTFQHKGFDATVALCMRRHNSPS